MERWRIYCMEDWYPGLWRRWFEAQVVAVGWPPGWGYQLEGKSKQERGWSRARAALTAMRPGDFVVAHLPGNRVGRVGEIVRTCVADAEWDPLVPPGPDAPYGEMGRRVLVRWTGDGPTDPDIVAQLPERTMSGQVGTANRLDEATFNRIRAACRDETSWVPVSAGSFGYEEALSDFIATYPHRLEDGLVAYPYAKTREKVFADRTRSDVLLQDPSGAPVVVECKQGPAAAASIKQLRGYMRHVRKALAAEQVRGILVHGGARKLSDAVRSVLREDRDLPVDVRRYTLRVDFDPSE